jgi:hypothetical protein
MSSARSQAPLRGAVALFALVVVLAALAGAAVRPQAAAAGGAGSWTNLSGQTGTNLTQSGLLVTPDGVLHVSWIRDAKAAGLQDLLWRDVKASGSFGPVKVLESGWSILNDPSVVSDPGVAAIDVVFGGMRSTAVSDPYDGLTLTTSTDGGAGWTLDPAGVIDPPGSLAYGSPVSAVVAGRILYTTWYGSDGVWVHRGVSSATPAYDYQSGLGTYGYYSNLALDGGGDLWLLWASNATGNSGVWAARVDQATGGMLGSPVKLPGSTTKWGGAQQFDMMLSRVPAAGRAAGGVFVAYPAGYPSTKSVRLWKVTASKTTSTVVATGSAEKTQTAIAADPKGRIWVVWSQHAGGRDRVYVRRSNVAATAFGPARYSVVPNGYPSVYHLAAVVRGGKLDVLAHLGGTKGEATWHIQFKPPA